MYCLQNFRDFSKCTVSLGSVFSIFALLANLAHAEDSHGSCLPHCTVFQNDKAIAEIEIEIRRLEQLSANQRKKLNQLNNELSVEKYNARRAQLSTRITSTQEDLSIAEINVGRSDSRDTLKEIREEINPRGGWGCVEDARWGCVEDAGRWWCAVSQPLPPP